MFRLRCTRTGAAVVLRRFLRQIVHTGLSRSTERLVLGKGCEIARLNRAAQGAEDQKPSIAPPVAFGACSRYASTYQSLPFRFGPDPPRSPSGLQPGATVLRCAQEPWLWPVSFLASR